MHFVRVIGISCVAFSTRNVNEYFELVYGSHVRSFHILYKDLLEFTDIRFSW